RNAGCVTWRAGVGRSRRSGSRDRTVDALLSVSQLSGARLPSELLRAGPDLPAVLVAAGLAQAEPLARGRQCHAARAGDRRAAPRRGGRGADARRPRRAAGVTVAMSAAPGTHDASGERLAPGLVTKRMIPATPGYMIIRKR